MKNTALILALLFGISAHAELKVGDSAHYALTLMNQAFEMSHEVSSIDSSAGTLNLLQTIYQNGRKVQQDTQKQTIQAMEQNETVHDVCLQLPASVNPRYENVTVPAGTLSTCHVTVTEESGTLINVYFGKVLFGIVKMVSETANQPSTTIELIDFKKN